MFSYTKICNKKKTSLTSQHLNLLLSHKKIKKKASEFMKTIFKEALLFSFKNSQKYAKS